MTRPLSSNENSSLPTALLASTQRPIGAAVAVSEFGGGGEGTREIEEFFEGEKQTLLKSIGDLGIGEQRSVFGARGSLVLCTIEAKIYFETLVYEPKRGSKEQVCVERFGVSVVYHFSFPKETIEQKLKDVGTICRLRREEALCTTITRVGGVITPRFVVKEGISFICTIYAVYSAL